MRFNCTFTLATFLMGMSTVAVASASMETEAIAPTSPALKTTVLDLSFKNRILETATPDEAAKLSQDLLETRLYFQKKDVTFVMDSDESTQIRLDAFIENVAYFVPESTNTTGTYMIQHTSWVDLCRLTLDLLKFLGHNPVQDEKIAAILPSSWQILLTPPERLLNNKERSYLVPLKTALLELLDSSVAPGLQALYIQQKIHRLRDRFTLDSPSAQDLKEAKTKRIQSDCNYFARRKGEKPEEIQKIQENLVLRSPIVLWNALTDNAPIELLKAAQGSKATVLDSRKLWKISTRFLKAGTDVSKYEKRANSLMQIMTKRNTNTDTSYFMTSMSMKPKGPTLINYWAFVPDKLNGPTVHDLLSIIGAGLTNSARLQLEPKIYGSSQLENTTLAPQSKRRSSKESGSFWNFLSK